MHDAPALAMMVVSEMGEMWSPQTAPAMQAEMEMTRNGLRSVIIAPVRMRAVSEPMTSPTEALLAAKESMKWW